MTKLIMSKCKTLKATHVGISRPMVLCSNKFDSYLFTLNGGICQWRRNQRKR